MKASRVSALAFAIVLSACATMQKSPGALEPGSRYVALGSSFAAGAGIGPTKPGTPARCQRTAINYASLVGERLRLALDDQTCGGAMTAHILGPWNELPAQMDAVTADTRLVTVTIGGNDLGYVMGLVGASCRAGTLTLPNQPCFPTKTPSATDYAKVEAGLNEVARQVAARGPKARLVFVQYVTLVPPTPCDAARLAPEDAAVSRAIGLRLAEITARVARKSGADVLPADELSREHSACSPEPWSRGMSAGYDFRQGAPWHPTAAGHAAIADALAVKLRDR